MFEGRKARRDSLSPDSASYLRRRDSKSHLSPDRNVDKRDISPIRQRKSRLRRQSTSIAGRPPRYLHSIDFFNIYGINNASFDVLLFYYQHFKLFIILF